jgi:TonB-dependent SusC/RagA subfamily outer membrane receptor
MIAAWVLTTLVLGALVAGAAWCAATLAQGRRWPERWAWAAGLLLLVALSAAAPWRGGARPDAALPAATVVTTGTAAVDATAPTALARVARTVGAARSAAQAALARAAALPAPAQYGFAAAWLLVSGAALATLAGAWRRMARATRALPVAQVDGVAVRVAPTGTPSVIGVRSPAIVLPAWALALPAPARAIVVAHERAHRDAHDTALLAAGALVVTLLPWHPVAWWLAARLATAIETDCDARVLAAGVAVRDYGALLLDVAATGRVPSLLAPWPALGGRRSTLETRILAMTASRPRFPLLRTGVLATAACALVAAACDSSRLPTSAEVETMDARGVQARMLTTLPGVDTAGMTWVVDGETVTAARAQAIAGDSIAAIDVRRENGTGTMRITTRRAALASGAVVRDSGMRVTIMRREGAPAGATDTTKRVAFMVVTSDSAPRVLDGARLPLPATASLAKPLVFIDGTRADDKAMQALGPDRILSVEVLKGDAATKLYGADGANGVIRITTKPR